MSADLFHLTFAKPLNEVIGKSSLNQYDFTEQKSEQPLQQKECLSSFHCHKVEIIYLVLAMQQL